MPLYDAIDHVHSSSTLLFLFHRFSPVSSAEELCAADLRKEAVFQGDPRWCPISHLPLD